MSTPNPTSRLIAVKAAAVAYGIPYSTLRDLVHRRELPVVRIGRRKWYLEREDLDRLIATRKSPTAVGA